MQRSASAASVSSTGASRCRLCWGEETEEAAGGSPLISPCNCRGSVGFIHVHCLQHWLEVSRAADAPCSQCRAVWKESSTQLGFQHAPCCHVDAVHTCAGEAPARGVPQPHGAL